jgi:hypothetical protein
MTLDEIHGEGVLAEYSSTCPICGDFVRAGRSMIVPLAIGLPLDPAYLTASRGNLIDRAGRPVRAREYAWIHVRCVAGVPDDLELARDERRAELRRMQVESRPVSRARKGGRR